MLQHAPGPSTPRRWLSTWLLALAVVASSACAGSVPPDDDDSGSDDGDDDSGSDDDDSGSDDDDSAPEPKLNVTEELGEGPTPPCSFQGDSCIHGYVDFTETAAEWAAPITEAELEAQLAHLHSGQLQHEEGSLSPSEMRELLVAELNIDFLLDGLDERPLVVSEYIPEPVPRCEVNWRAELEGFRLVWLGFDDPFIGAFEVVLLLPDTPPPYPGVVVHPGHFEGGWTHLDERYGPDLAAAGYLLAAITPRANDAWDNEDQVARHLLRNGFTFMGLRVYEILLVRKYLRWRADVAGVGVLGHSGGSSTANLAVWVEPTIEAYISDLTTAYTGWNEEGMIMDEALPGLAPWANQISELWQAEVEVLQVPYGYPDGPQPLIDFFDEEL